MLRRFTEPTKYSRKLLFGNDTDVSDCIITKYGDNFLIVDIMIDETNETIFPITRVINKEEFKKEFELQYDSPMQYLNEGDYKWIIE